MTDRFKLEKTEANSQAFLDLTHSLYSKIEIPHTSQPKSTYLIGCYVLYDNDSVVGRFALYDNPSIRVEDKKTLALGSYECIDDFKISVLLITKIKETAKRLGAVKLIGPMEGSTWQNYRFTVTEQDLFFTEMCHKSYYPSQFKKSSFDVLKTYSSTLNSNIEVNENRLEHFKNRLNKQNLVIRNIDLTNFEAELITIADFSNTAFKSNFLFSEFTANSFVAKYLSIKNYVKAELFYLVENSEGNLQGFLFCIPNYFDSKNESIIVKSMAILPKRNLAGLGIYLGELMYKKALELGYSKAIHAYMINENKSIGLSNRFNAEAYKTHHLYTCDV